MASALALAGGAAVRCGARGAESRLTGPFSEGFRTAQAGVLAAADGRVLRGTEFALEVAAKEVSFTGATRTATVVNGGIPAPLLCWRQGDTVTVRVTNRLPVPTSIHWHGVLVPANMDGVPGLSFGGIRPGETFLYRFPVRQSGTYWYHSHSRFQEQIGLYGPIVIEPRDREQHAADREHVILLSDWTDDDPEHIYRTLKRQSDYYNFGQRTVADFLHEARQQGLGPTVTDRLMWGRMRMDPTDLVDVSGYAFTYLLNGATPAANWTGLFRRGERVRLRIINGSSMSFFDIRIPGLKLTIVAADGQEVEPVTIDEFRIAAGEVYDVMVEPQDDRAYTLFAQSADRSGYARGTLAPAPGMQAEIPSMDPRPVLSMLDMGMAMSGMDSHEHGRMSVEARDRMHRDAHGEMNMGGQGGIDSGQHGGMDMGSHTHGGTPGHFGPNVDMIAEHPMARLDDPGVGLRSNGRQVLSYAALHTLGGPIDQRGPQREIRLHLTGHMQRYVWSFNGQKFSESAPLRFRYGERLRLVLVNDTMMAHPIHLHGMWSEVSSSTGEFLVRKHTVVVQPGQQLSYAVTADALGRWAFHCHLLYHMEAGMFREVVVA